MHGRLPVPNDRSEQSEASIICIAMNAALVHLSSTTISWLVTSFAYQGSVAEATVAQKFNQGSRTFGTRNRDVIDFGRLFGYFFPQKSNRRQNKKQGVYIIIPAGAPAKQGIYPDFKRRDVDS